MHALTITRMQGEAASIMLNACYEKQNVTMAIKANAVVDLSWLLASDSDDVAANATGQCVHTYIHIHIYIHTHMDHACK